MWKVSTRVPGCSEYSIKNSTIKNMCIILVILIMTSMINSIIMGTRMPGFKYNHYKVDGDFGQVTKPQ